MEALILTEGGAQQGFGHVVRCVALGEAFVAAGLKPMLCINGDDAFNSMIRNLDVRFFDWRKNDDWLSRKISDAAVVVIDSYLADSDDYQRISKRAKKAVFIDDSRRLDYPSGIIVNFASYAEKIYPVKKSENEYLLGNSYVLLRRGFLAAAGNAKTSLGGPKKVFVSFGGGDPRNFTVKTLDLLRKSKYAHLNSLVVVGSSRAHDELFREFSGSRTEFLYQPDEKQLIEAMTASDMAISAAGMTLYELAYCQKPTIAVAVADNQQRGLNDLVAAGFIRGYLDWQDSFLFERMEEMLDFYIANYALVLSKNASLGRELVDGLGGDRLAAEIVKRIHGRD